jgi:hypothetical protein
MNQTLFAVGALTLLGILVLPAQRTSLNRQQILMATEATNTATAIGQELIEEISVRKFDENYCGRGDSATSASLFCAALTLETSKGDTAGRIWTYDDVDDFNAYASTIATPRLGGFRDSCKVYYVTEDAPDVVSATQTYLKRIDVKIRNSYILSKDSTITVSKIISYRYRGGT